MNKSGKFLPPFAIRLFGAIVASAGFIVLVFKPDATRVSIALVGIGSLIISIGDDK